MQRSFKPCLAVVAMLGLATAAYAAAPPVVHYSQNFNSLTQNSPLAGQDGWTSLVAGNGTLNVDSNSLLVSIAPSGGTNTQIKKDFGALYSPATNEINIHLTMTPQTAIGNTMFYIWLGNHPSGPEARWRFGDDWSRLSGSVATTGQMFMTNGPGNGAIGIANDVDIKVLITSPVTATAELFVNGVGSGAIAADMLAGGLRTLRMELLTSANGPGQSIRIDDLVVGTVPEPATLAMLVLGGLPMLLRRRTA